MSDTAREGGTPRVDARIKTHAESAGLRELAGYYNDLLDFARQLERELSEARRERDEADKQLGEERLLHIHSVEALRQELERTVERAEQAEQHAARVEALAVQLDIETDDLLQRGFTVDHYAVYIPKEIANRIRALAHRKESSNED